MLLGWLHPGRGRSNQVKILPGPEFLILNPQAAGLHSESCPTEVGIVYSIQKLLNSRPRLNFAKLLVVVVVSLFHVSFPGRSASSYDVRAVAGAIIRGVVYSLCGW